MRIRSLPVVALFAAMAIVGCGFGGSSNPTPTPTPLATQPAASSGPGASGPAESGAPTEPSSSSGVPSGPPSTLSTGPSAPPPSAGGSAPPSGSAESPVAGLITPECQAANLQTKQPGKLTVNTDNPAFSPWFEGKVPSGSDWGSAGGYPPSGQGFESAIAFAIANELGFTDDQVEWSGNANFNDAFKPGAKDYDFHLAQDSYKKKRADSVDFSKSYYDVAQAVVAQAHDPIADATTVAELQQYKLGAAEGTTSFDAIEQEIQPTTDAKSYPDNDKAVQALKNGNIDGIVVDLPTAFFILTELSNGKVVGQLPALGGEQEYFGIVLEKDSPMTACVNEAIDAIKADGSWQSIFDQWLASSDTAPVLQ